MMPMVYTRKLWKAGKDEFVGLKKALTHTVDLFEWLHLLPIQRAMLLAHKARFINVESLPLYEVHMKSSVDSRFEKDFEMLELQVPQRLSRQASLAPESLSAQAHAALSTVGEV